MLSQGGGFAILERYFSHRDLASLAPLLPCDEGPKCFETLLFGGLKKSARDYTRGWG